MGIRWETSQFMGGVDALLQRVESATNSALSKGGQVMVATTQQTAPVLTGTLRRSIYAYDKVQTGSTFTIKVAPHTVYARQRELGGPIKSKGPWLLRNKDTGITYGRFVMQTGSHYFSRGVEAAAPQIQGAIEQAWAQALGG